MREILENYDWANSALGEKVSWSSAMKIVVTTCMQSRSPILTLWGNDFIQVYNEAYRDIFESKYPGAFGAKTKDVWKDTWEKFSPILHIVLNEGKAVTLEDHPVSFDRQGSLKNLFFTFSFSPICDESQNIEGIFVTLTENTKAVEKATQIKMQRDAQIKSLFTQAPVALAIFRGPEFVVEIANERMLELWGKTAEQVVGKPVFIAIPEGRDQGYEDLFNRVFHKGERVILDESPLTLMRAGKRQDFVIKLIYEPLREDDGSISGIMALADEITEQVNFRRRIEESEMRLKLATESANIGTFDWHIPESVFKFSDKLAQMFGYTDTATLTQQSFADRIHPDDRQTRLTAHKKAFETGTLFYEARVVWPDESIHWVRLNGKVTYDANNNPLRLHGTTLNIDLEKSQSEKLERLVAERTSKLQERNEQLYRSEERYHKMVEEVQDYAIILLDTNGIIQNWNQGAEKIKQYREAEIVGKRFDIFYLPGDRESKLPDTLLNQAIQTGRAIHEGWRMRKDGTKFWGSITLTALHDKQNSIIGFSKVTRDLTERKLAEERMRDYMLELESQNRDLEQFAYVASHDLQEPLRKIRTFSEMIQDNLENESLVKNYLDRINRSAQRMSELISSVLNYSRLSRDEEQMTATDLNLILSGVLSDFELLIQEKNAKIETNSLPVIVASAFQMNQLFANLISNALKFTLSNPVIKVFSRLVTKDEVKNKPENLAHSNYNEISFTDNGIGFDQKYERTIFSMFKRLHGKNEFTGTGIGLALCKKIMESHGGHITAEGELSGGSVFYIYFPA